MKEPGEVVDVTDQVVVGEIELLVVRKCVCGQEFASCENGVYRCPNCGRGFYFRASIKVFQVL